MIKCLNTSSLQEFLDLLDDSVWSIIDAATVAIHTPSGDVVWSYVTETAQWCIL